MKKMPICEFQMWLHVHDTASLSIVGIVLLSWATLNKIQKILHSIKFSAREFQV